MSINGSPSQLLVLANCRGVRFPIGRLGQWAILTLNVLVFATSLNSVNAEEMSIQLRNGMALTVDVEPHTLNWTNVLADGQMTSSRILLSDIERLWITSEPASKQVALVRKLLFQLGSPVYEDREAAEKQLSNAEIGGPYRSLIELQKDHQTFEVRYRVGRILTVLSNIRLKNSKPTQFDRILMKNGTVLDGDAGDLKLDFEYAGRKAEFGREQLQAIGTVRKREFPHHLAEKVSVQLFHDYTKGFYLPEQTTIDFELDSDGNEMKKFFDVSDAFTNLGVRFSTELQGFVGVSGYRFKVSPEKPASGNSVCVCDTSTSFSKRFKGVLEIRFCIPGQPQLAAGVLECGFLIERVSHNRDFLMEAYNADGHMLATVEAGDEQCVFMGVKSNEPIAFVRILSNPYLHRLSRAIDEDYAIDSLCFSIPIPIAHEDTQSDINLVRLRNGDQLLAENVKFFDNATIDLEVETFAESFVVEVAAVEEIDLANDLARHADDWLAMLEDGSVIKVDPDKNNRVASFSGESLESDELIGITRGVFRYPVAGDFEFSKIVLVLPTCRIVTDSVDFESNRLSWRGDAKKIIQPIYNNSDPHDDDDPTPGSTRVELDGAIPSDIPTIWFSQPGIRDSHTGLIQLVDGQQFVLGNGAKFEVRDMNSEGLTVAWRGKSTKVPWEEVRSLQFPDKDLE